MMRILAGWPFYDKIFEAGCPCTSGNLATCGLMEEYHSGDVECGE
jgi:hypothetical protein